MPMPSTRNSGDPRGRRAFSQSDRETANDNLWTAGFFDRWFRNRWMDDDSCDLYRIHGCKEYKLAFPRHRLPGRQVVQLHAVSLCDLIHHGTRPKAF